MIHPIKHFRTITHHIILVRHFCFKSGLYKQGLLHDLSKYSFTEFWRGAKYFSGKYSPNHNERLKKGYSLAWMHHKGRNKHHVEYWVDVDIKAHMYKSVDMPNRYIAESMCDRIAASKIYRKKEFKPMDVKAYYEMESKMLNMSSNTKEKFDFLMDYYIEHGQKELFKYLKANYRK